MFNSEIVGCLSSRIEFQIYFRLEVDWKQSQIYWGEFHLNMQLFLVHYIGAINEETWNSGEIVRYYRHLSKKNNEVWGNLRATEGGRKG